MPLKAIIDNISSNFISPDIISGNITATISDHLPQFSFVPNILSNPPTQKSNCYERDWSKFKQENFTLDCFDKDWGELLQIDQQNVNLSLDSVLNNVNSILDVHAQASAYAKQGCATIRHLVMKFRGYRCVKSHTPPTK